MEKLLLHHCCAPCSPAVLNTLSGEFEVISFWFNPNIQPKDEREKRKETLIAFLKPLNRNLIAAEESASDSLIWQNKKDPVERCKLCYQLRLSRAAAEAKRLKIYNFSTTLISSPHQKHEEIKSAGERIAKEENVNFIYRDFRPFYYDGVKKVKFAGLYSQKYCGCLQSLEEVKK